MFLASGYAPACADGASSPFGWDLSYKSVFRQPAVLQNDSVARFFRNTAPARDKNSAMRLPPALFENIDPARVQTAILVDYRAFWFKGNRVTLFYVRMPGSAYVDLYESSSGRIRRRILELPRFDKLDHKLARLEQELPMFSHKFRFPPHFVYSGYIGVLSQYRNGKSSQMLLTAEDILLSDMTPGRVTSIVNRAMGIP